MSLEKKNTRWNFPTQSLFILGGMLVFVMAQASWTQAQKYSAWSAPVNLGPIINSSLSDQGPAISKDELSLYFTSNRSGSLGGFDMYVSQRVSVADPWDPPVNLGPMVNTTSDEGNPAFSRDGHYLFFQSKRPGGFGGIDLWVAYREHTHDDFDWQLPVNLGAAINSIADDNGPTYFANEGEGAPQLYFGSLRTGLGAADLYVSEQLADGSFGPAVLVTDLSSSVNENRPSIRHDGREIFFQSNRVGPFGANADLWVATRDNTLDAWGIPINLGTTINSISVEQNAYVSADNKTLLFSSDRTAGSGGLDLYISTRTKAH